MAKKRPTLDAFLNSQTESKSEALEVIKNSAIEAKVSSVKKKGKEVSQKEDLSSSIASKREVIRHMLYLPLPVYDQLQSLIFEEQRGQMKRRKTHDYLMDAIDLLFKEKGLKSIADLTKKE